MKLTILIVCMAMAFFSTFTFVHRVKSGDRNILRTVYEGIATAFWILIAAKYS